MRWVRHAGGVVEMFLAGVGRCLLSRLRNRKFAAALGNRHLGDWVKPPDCARWDVRALAGDRLTSWSPA